MKFFTPGLYLRYSSSDDVEANQADEDWEKAIRDYKDHLKKISKNMNERIKTVADGLCLHDAELLSFQEDVPKSSPTSPVFPAPVAIISLRHNSNITNLIYMLWGSVGQSTPSENWPFSKLRTHWLYDEIDLDGRLSYHYLHRVLLSDGRVIRIPFFDVVVQTFSENNPEVQIISRRRA